LRSHVSQSLCKTNCDTAHCASAAPDDYCIVGLAAPVPQRRQFADSGITKAHDPKIALVARPVASPKPCGSVENLRTGCMQIVACPIERFRRSKPGPILRPDTPADGHERTKSLSLEGTPLGVEPRDAAAAVWPRTFYIRVRLQNRGGPLGRRENSPNLRVLMESEGRRRKLGRMS